MFVTVAVGCAYTAELQRSPYINQAALSSVTAASPAKNPEDIVFLRKLPEDKPFVVLGTLHAPETEWTAHYTNDDLIEAMRVKAAELGGDAVVDFRAEQKPTIVGQGYYDPVSRTGSMTVIPYKGLHAWGEVIMYVTEQEQEQIEPGQ